MVAPTPPPPRTATIKINPQFNLVCIGNHPRHLAPIQRAQNRQQTRSVGRRKAPSFPLPAFTQDYLADKILSECSIAKEISEKLRRVAYTSEDLAKLSGSVVDMLKKLEKDPKFKTKIGDVKDMLSNWEF